MVTMINLVPIGDHGTNDMQFCQPIIVFLDVESIFFCNDAIDYIEELDNQMLENVDVIDIVELPPEKFDLVSDEEEFLDEEDLGFGDNEVISVPGYVETSCAAVDLAPLPSAGDENLLSSQVQSNESDSASTSLAEVTPNQASKKQKTAPSKKKNNQKEPKTKRKLEQIQKQTRFCSQRSL